MTTPEKLKIRPLVSHGFVIGAGMEYHSSFLAQS
jgi:hypothetical protein